MKEDRDEQPDFVTGGGGSAPAGKDFNPSDLSDDEAAAAERPSRAEAVPIGRPVTDEQYRRMKERAESNDSPPDGSHAQEDPAHREHNG
ncbi:MAG: hypothetical protein M3416_07975 [Acidobacteriota bacterium]|nr:hypothetical protein [Acidobacteriota bacterium]